MPALDSNLGELKDELPFLDVKISTSFSIQAVPDYAKEWYKGTIKNGWERKYATAITVMDQGGPLGFSLV